MKMLLVLGVFFGTILGSLGGDIAWATPPQEHPNALNQGELLEGALGISLEITGDFAPFEWVRYQLKEASGNPILTYARRYRGGFKDDDNIELISQQRRETLQTRLQECGVEALLSAASLSSPLLDKEGKEVAAVAPPPRVKDSTSGLQLQLEVISKDHSRRLLQVSDVRPSTHPVWFCIRDVLADAAQEVVGEQPFMMAFVATKERGFIDFNSTPPTQVFVDGIPLPGVTPIWHHPVPAGSRNLRFVNAEHDIDQSFDVKVILGSTTYFDVDLD